MDEKGRVSIPSRFREALGGLRDGRLVLAPFVDRGFVGIEVFPFDAWLEFEKALETHNNPNEEVTLDMIYARVSSSSECTLDAQGRILVPPELRELAGLGRDVAFSGHIGTFRLWDADAWRTVSAKAREVFPSAKSLQLRA